jgi:hypothetical protein
MMQVQQSVAFESQCQCTSAVAGKFAEQLPAGVSALALSKPPQDPPILLLSFVQYFWVAFAYCLHRNGGTLYLVIREPSITLRQRCISPQFHHKFSQAIGAAEAATIPCQTRQCSESTAASPSRVPPSHLADDVAGGTRGRTMLFE